MKAQKQEDIVFTAGPFTAPGNCIPGCIGVLTDSVQEILEIMEGDHEHNRLAAQNKVPCVMTTGATH